MGFALAGAKVGLLARTEAELDLTKLEIEQAGGTALKIRADVRRPDEMATAVNRMVGAFGGLHVLIAAAGVPGPIGPLLGTKTKAWNEAIETNLIGMVNSCRAALPPMIEKRSGKIIAIAGNGAAFARPNFSAYAASKAAVVRFAECLAEEKAGRKEVEEAEQVRITGGIAPDRQIQLALFLASERANHISGKLIYVSDDWKRFERDNMKPELY